ncbi:MAG TPA: cation-transporting P-type ATPase [Acidimicrobiia bacterium]|jgi:Ca2+-transporting ATPase
MTAGHGTAGAASGSTAERAPQWYALAPDDVAQQLGTDVERGLSATEASTRLEQYGANVLQQEAKASMWEIALQQVRDPMNIMLIAVTVVSIIIGQPSTAVVVALLVLLNVALGTRQELAARASVDALAEMQIPQARVVRDGQVQGLPASDVVPGDVVNVEAGDIVVADGRIVRSANLETQEAALTGESAPIPKDATAVTEPDVALGDRTDMLFQNTAVTRGTASFIVTGTGMQTEVGKIAGLLQSVTRTKSPLQQQLDTLTKWLGVVAWTALAIVVVIGLARDLPFDDVLLLGTAMAISAIPTGMPTFVQGMLSYGSRRLAEARAIVRNLTDVETLGSTSAINTDKTGTLTLNQMTATRLFFGGDWFNIEGGGYSKQGSVLGVAGGALPDFSNLALALVLSSDATVGDDGTVVGDPTEAALVVLAAKLGVDAGLTRRKIPRIAEVPFDSAYKYMATFHDWKDDQGERIVELVKGAPDIVLGLSTEVLWHGQQVPADDVRQEVLDANRELSERGLRVLALAFRRFPTDQDASVRQEPMAQVGELVFGGLVGIIDPLRAEAKDAVVAALAAGIDVRMITGDHAITAKAIADQLGLGEGVISGPEFAKLTDDALRSRMDGLHVFGRVAPQDKLRLVEVMQGEGLVVAMTGDAVNDAAALKKADIGVAMGSGSEVSKQAAKMVLTDDNFATLVNAVALGRDIWHKITAYIRYQMSQLFGLVSMFLAAAIFDVNSGVALLPLMVIFLNFFVAVFPVAAVITDVTDPSVMQDTPRDPKVQIFNRTTGPRWIVYGLVLGAMSLGPLVLGPDEPQIDGPSISMTMAFAVMGLSTVLSGFVMRHDRRPAVAGPLLKYAGILGMGALMVVFATQFGFLQRWLDTTSLTADQWAVVLGLALVMPVVVELDKAWQRHRARAGGAHA